jgi:hypothetical protein
VQFRKLLAIPAKTRRRFGKQPSLRNGGSADDAGSEKPLVHPSDGFLDLLNRVPFPSANSQLHLAVVFEGRMIDRVGTVDTVVLHVGDGAAGACPAWQATGS